MNAIQNFFALFRFKTMYTKQWNNAVSLFFLFVFLWSLAGAAMSATGAISSSSEWVFVVGAIVALAGVVKDLSGFIRQFNSHGELDDFEHRSEEQRQQIVAVWKSVRDDLFTGFKVQQIICGEKDHGDGDFVDFISWSKDLNRQLADGAKIKFVKQNWRKTKLWRHINEHLSEAVGIIALKLKASGHSKFRNEMKIVMTKGPKPIRVSGADSESGIDVFNIEVCKSCYYASYLTNEFYRDHAFDYDQDSIIYDGDKWNPLAIVNGQNAIANFDDAHSWHIGVNTLGITTDGNICLWRQHSGQFSYNKLSPSGSGSMDWNDLRHAKGDRIETAVIYGAERELSEEAFDSDTRMALRKMKNEGFQIQTSIAGMFRWGSRGGLPGFVLVSLIPLKFGDIKPPKNGEVRSQKKRSGLCIAPSIISRTGNFEDWCVAAAQTVSEFSEKNIKELSVPLFACLSFFKDELDRKSKTAVAVFAFLNS